jgi:hypothetical protein
MAILVTGAAWAALVLYLLCRALRQFRTIGAVRLHGKSNPHLAGNREGLR